MSFKAFVWAWDQDVPNGDHQHILLALANIAPARETFASVPYIAEEVRRSPRKVRAALDWLCEAGIITMTRRPGKTDLIRMNIPTDFRIYMPDDPEDHEAGKRGRPKKTPAPLEGKPSQNSPPRGADEPKEPEEGTFLVCKAREPFDVWWDRYPLKKAKDAARLAFSKAMRRLREDPEAEPVSVLMSGVERYIEEIARTGVLIKHPATWLNGGCWNDEPDTNGSQTDGQPTRHPGGIDRAAERDRARVEAALAGAQQAINGIGGRRWRL